MSCEDPTPSQSEQDTTTTIQQHNITIQQSQERNDNMTRGSPSLFVETRQNDLLESTSQRNNNHAFAQHPNHLEVLNRTDAMAGSTEVQLLNSNLLKVSFAATTPPTSPVGRKLLFPEMSPSSASTSSPSKTKSCGQQQQRRGRFLVWPVSAIVSSPHDGSSARDTSSTTSTTTDSSS